MLELFRGELVRLAAVNAEETASLSSRWNRDSLRGRLLDSNPSILFSDKAIRGWIEKNQEKDDEFSFAIRTLAEDRMVGEVGLGYAGKSRSDAFMGIGLGEREDWNKGYGTDAVRLILRYAFLELNLDRVSLNLFEYNLRAKRAYEKAGFVEEGRARSVLLRDGRRWNEIFMGVLRPDWMKAYGSQL